MQTVAAIDPALPSVTVLHQYNVAVRQAPDKYVPPRHIHHQTWSNDSSRCRVRIAAVVPTESGQIGINPPVNGPTYVINPKTVSSGFAMLMCDSRPANIEAHTRYLKVEGGATKVSELKPANL